MYNVRVRSSKVLLGVLPSSPKVPVLLFLFFLSGISGLIYQVLWLRRLSIIFGVTVYAASTVLSAFMAGLAIGGLLANRLLRRQIHPLAAFGIAELLVGVTALLSPWLLDALLQIYLVLHSADASPSFGLQTLVRFLYAFAVLLLPTAMMGVTLPLLTAATAASPRTTGNRVSWLYTVNTAGAIAGTVAAGFYLIPAIGIRGSFLLAASANFIVGGTALWLSRHSTALGPEPDREIAVQSPGLESSRGAIASTWTVVVVSGFASLGLEVVWFRLLLQFVTTTTHAFTAMLATVLSGLAIGGAIAAWILRRDRDWFGWLAGSQAAAGVTALASLNALMWTLRHGWSTNEIAPAVIIAILPPAVLMGIGFPLTIGLALKQHRDGGGHLGQREGGAADQPPPKLRRSAEVVAKVDGARIGGLYAGNMVGAISGSLITGFILLPFLGSTSSLVVLAALYVATGVGLLWFARRRIAFAALVGVVTIALVLLARRMPDPFRVGIERRYGTTVSEIWRHEGVQTTASVHANTFQRVLYLDGLHQANDQAGMVQLHRTIAHLPMVLHSSPTDVLVIGLGGGATSGAISQHAGSRVQVVELSESVRRAAELFSHVNYDVLTRPNVQFRIDDGRNFLQRTRRTFDVIAADIIQPGHAGAGHVYSHEYFSLVRRALREDGVALQWIGHRPPVEYKLIMRTFLDVFPDATLWHGGTLMVGTRRPLRLSPSLFERHRANPETRAALDAAQLTSFDALRGLYTAGPEQMRSFVGAGPLLTDNRPLVEYGWVPAHQPPLDLSPLTADVSLIVDDSGYAPQ
jgi:spermidine synthase